MSVRKTLAGILVAVVLVALVVYETREATGLYWPLAAIYFIVDEPMTVLFLGAFTLLLYFAVFRFSQSLNRYLGVIGETLTLLACVIFLFVSASKSWSWPFRDWQVYSLVAGVYLMLVGGLLVCGTSIWL
jgi:hypothetical protein